MDLPNPGIELGSPVLQADSLPTELSGKPKKAFRMMFVLIWLGRGLCLMFAVALVGASLEAQLIKNPPAMQKTWV